jgi:hypothetical protein
MSHVTERLDDVTAPEVLSPVALSTMIRPTYQSSIHIGNLYCLPFTSSMRFLKGQQWPFVAFGH